MVLDRRKALAVEFVKSIARGHFREGLLAPDMKPWTLFSGDLPREEYLRRITVVGQIFPTGLQITIDRVTAEEDRVVIQARGEGILITGAHYAQSYIFVVEFDDQDRVRHCREYMDIRPVTEMLVPAMAQSRRDGSPPE